MRSLLQIDEIGPEIIEGFGLNIMESDNPSNWLASEAKCEIESSRVAGVIEQQCRDILPTYHLYASPEGAVRSLA